MKCMGFTSHTHMSLLVFCRYRGRRRLPYIETHSQPFEEADGKLARIPDLSCILGFGGGGGLGRFGGLEFKLRVLEV